MSELSKNLCTALDEIRTELENDGVLEALKNVIESFIKQEKTKKKIELVLDETSARIKSTSSFKEKIARKNYLNEWGLNEDSSLDDCKKAIREKLGDLIGIRINCFFKDDEKIIYDDVVTFLQSKLEIVVPPRYKNDVTTLKTGDKLYKISCKFKHGANLEKICFFELQMKCMVHNLWGEVEHEIAYKAKQYDYGFKAKNKQLRDIYASLKSSDSQLKTLFACQYTEQDMLNSLFFLYTQKKVQDDIKGKNPTQAYTWFFQIFEQRKDSINEYVKHHLNGTAEFLKMKYQLNKQDEVFDYLVNNVLKLYFRGRFKDLFAIASILFDGVSDANINEIIAQEILNIVKSSNEILTKILEEDETEMQERSAYEDEDEDEEFYQPTLYHKKQKKINEIICELGKDVLDKKQKDVLLECVEFLYKVISDGNELALEEVKK